MRTMRPELSKKNKHWISKERYYELKHFCLQYNDWCMERKLIYDANPSMCFGLARLQGKAPSDPTATLAEATERLTRRIEMIEKCAKEADEEFCEWIILAVTNDMSCHKLIARGMPCGKDKFYSMYHKFFWYLSKARD